MMPWTWQGMWRMLQSDEPQDFVLATGECHTVREFVEKSFKVIDIEVKWEGKGDEEIGKDAATGKTIVRIDPKYYRPAEVELLVGDASKASKILKWTPKCSLDNLVKEMVLADIEGVKKCSDN